KTGEIASLAVGPAGKTVAAVSRQRGSSVCLWRVTNPGAVSEPQLLGGLELQAGSIHALSFSPDGGALAAISETGTVTLWNIAANKIIATMNGQATRSAVLAFAGNGKELALGCDDGTILIWDWARASQR